MSKTNEMNDKVMRCLKWVAHEYEQHWSTHHFEMEHGGYRSNHVLHGLGALGLLGASQDKMEAFATAYVQDVQVRHVDDRATSAGVMDLHQARELLGKHQNFATLREVYANEMKELGTEQAIRKHLPKLVPGLAGRLLHGIIQLGYAYRVGTQVGVAEGLAYMHYSYLSFEDPAESSDGSMPQGQDDKKKLTRQAVWALLQDLRGDQHVLQELHEQLDKTKSVETELGSLQHRLIAFSSDPARGDPTLFATVSAIVNDFDAAEMDGSFALDFIVWLYGNIEQNDFVVLHAVTSAWSLHQVEHLLAPSDRQRAWMTWVRVVVSAYIAHEAPELKENDVCSDLDMASATLPTWDELITKTLELPDTTDPHVHKLVQVVYELGTSTPSAKSRSGFLTTQERVRVMQHAATKVINQDFAM